MQKPIAVEKVAYEKRLDSGEHIHNDGVTVRFVFDGVRTSQLRTNCQKQSNVDAPNGVLYIHSSHSNFVARVGDMLYIHLRGAFSVARFDNLGNAKAFTPWNEHQTGSTFFIFVYNGHKVKTLPLESWLIKTDYGYIDFYRILRFP